MGWGLFAVVDLMNQRLINPDFAVAMSRTALVVPSLVMISAAMRSIYASRRFDNRMSLRVAGWVALLSLIGAALVAALEVGARELVGWTTPGRSAFDEFLIPLVHYALALAAWSIFYFWVHAEIAEQAEHKRAMRAEAEALRAELEELRLQLDPHFLFNALNGLAEEIPEHPGAALAMLRDLTAYLRYSLDGIHRTVATVEAEAGGLAAYLRVQQARFGEQLESSLHVDPQAAPRAIASFLLQPLVENAVKHGRRGGGLNIVIDIRAAGNDLQIEIENTGTLDKARNVHPRRPGIGLENVRRRLGLHYPGRHRFSLRERDAEVSTVVATLLLEGEPCSGS